MVSVAVGAAARIASLSFSRAIRVGSGSCARYWSITVVGRLACAQFAVFAFATFLVLTAFAIGGNGGLNLDIGVRRLQVRVASNSARRSCDSLAPVSIPDRR